MYSVKLLIASHVEESSSEEKIWEEQIILVHAPNEHVAKEKAERLIRISPYENADGNIVHHTLARILDIFKCVDSFSPSDDGKEVYSRFFITPGHWTTERCIRHFQFDQ